MVHHWDRRTLLGGQLRNALLQRSGSPSAKGERPQSQLQRRRRDAGEYMSGMHLYTGVRPPCTQTFRRAGNT